MITTQVITKLGFDTKTVVQIDYIQEMQFKISIHPECTTK